MEGGSAGLVVSIHDVAPSTLPEVRWLLARLDEVGVAPRVLKVIPRASGADDIRRHPDLVELLTEEIRRGSELVLHGLRHRVPPGARLGGRALDRLRARLFAGDAAEFLALDHRAAAEAIEEGSALLDAVGLEAVGFCPPAWLARPGLSSILRDLGFRYACWFGSLEDLRTGRRHRIPAWGYMGSDAFDEALVGLEGLLVRTLGSWVGVRVTRVFLHPQGAPRSPACAAVLRAVARRRRDHEPVTYRELLDG